MTEDTRFELITTDKYKDDPASTQYDNVDTVMQEFCRLSLNTSIQIIMITNVDFMSSEVSIYFCVLFKTKFFSKSIVFSTHFLILRLMNCSCGYVFMILSNRKRKQLVLQSQIYGTDSIISLRTFLFFFSAINGRLIFYR